MPDFAIQVVDANGAPYSGAKLYTYEAGTTTPLATYSNTNRTSANANPIVADSAGRFGPIFIKPQAYYLELYTSANVLITSRDNVVDLGSLVYANLPSAPGMNALTSLLVGLFADPALATPKPVDGSYITTAAATIYTVPASTIAIVNSITLFNADTVTNDAQIAIVASGNAVNVAASIAGGGLAPTQTTILSGPWFLEAGDFISGVSASATGTDLSVRVDLAEMTAQLTGATLLFDDGDALTASLATYFTATALTTLYALTIYNSDTVDRVVTVEIIQSGGSAGNNKTIFGSAVGPKQTVIVAGPFIFETGDFLQAKAASASVVSLRLTAFTQV